MEFADSFFEDIEDCESEKVKHREKPPYSVKRCEPEVRWREIVSFPDPSERGE